MKCINDSCGIELPEDANFCYKCGTVQDCSSTSLYNWLAFISYSHADTDVAIYIENELKKYHIPAVIGQDNPELEDVRFDQIFRDANSFGNGSLENNINHGLQHSKYLIEICSPNSARPNKDGINWCDEEIKQFLKYHNNNENLIIPIIIDGVPHSKNECFPPTLLGLSNDVKMGEALGIDGLKLKTFIEGNGTGEEKESLTSEEKFAKDNIFDSIKARLLGLSYGAYRNYAHKEKYYKDYVDKNAIPSGIHELTNAEWKKTNHYKFIYREDLLEEVKYENGNGFVTEQSNPEKILDSVFFYDAKNRLIKIEDRDLKGKTIRVQDFKKNYSVVNYSDKNDDSKRLSGSFSTSGDSEKAKSDIKSIRLIRDKNGFIIKKTFHKYHDEIFPVSDNDGIYGLEYENDELGRVKKFWYLDENGYKLPTQTGVAGKVYEYDKDDNQILKSFVDEKENFILSYDSYIRNRYSTVQKKYDENGNCIEESYFGINGEKVLLDESYSKICKQYDEYGNCTEESYYGLNNELVLYSPVRKTSYAKLCKKYDEYGNCTEESYHGLNNELVLTSKGYSKICRKYDKRRNCMEEAYFGKDNEAVVCRNNYAKICIKYDEQDNEIERSYYGVNNEPVIIDYEYSKECIKYDEYGNEIEVSYYGTNGEPVLSNRKYSKECVRYDERGNCTEVSYYGTNNEPILSRAEYSKCCFKYDEHGNCIEESYYGVNDEPVINRYGYSKVCRKYNERGYCIEESYFGINDEPIINDSEYSKEYRKYDGRGNCIEVSYFGVNGEPVISLSGYSKCCRKYDEQGKIIEESFFNEKNELIKTIHHDAEENKHRS